MREGRGWNAEGRRGGRGERERKTRERDV